MLFMNYDDNDENWLKIGQSYKNDNDEESTTQYKKKAVDFFSDSSSDRDISDRSLKDESPTKNKNVNVEEKKFKKIRRMKKFLIKNPFESEDIKNNFSNTNKLEIYSAEHIFEKLSNTHNNKKRRRFVDKFELKKIKFRNIDIFLTFDNINRNENYVYGSLQSKEIPIFKRLNLGKILGIKNNLLSKILLKELNEMTGDYFKEKIGERPLRYFQYNIKTNTNSLIKYEKVITNKAIGFNFRKDFIGFLPDISPPIQQSSTDTHICEDHQEEEDLKLKINYNLFQSEIDRIILEKNRNYNKKLMEKPSNIELWCEYINFQDRICSMLNKSEKLKIEMKLVIIEKAVNANNENLALNILYLRVLEKSNNEGNFEFVNNEWLRKIVFHSNSKKFVQEYLCFLKTRRNLSVNDMRDRYTALIKFYESQYLSTLELENKFQYSLIIIDIIIDLVILEKDSGFYEKSFALLRSFIEIISMRFKNMIKENSTISFYTTYAEYFDSEYPKICDFEKNLGFIEYIQNIKHQYEEIFYHQDFIEYSRNINTYADANSSDDNLLIKLSEKEIYSKNFRSSNIIYDKDNLDSNSFIFYSDIKDFVEIKFLL